MSDESLPGGACDQELKDLKKAKDDLDLAYRGYLSADWNLNAGAWGTGVAWLTGIGCAAAATGIGGVICVAGAGAGLISGAYWTASAGLGLRTSADGLE